MSTNYLLNPLHLDARAIKVVSCKWIEYDQRLFRVRNSQIDPIEPRKQSKSKPLLVKRHKQKKTT